MIDLADARHIAAAAKFNVIAARKIILAVELPPGDVHVHAADAIVSVRRQFFELRNEAPAVAAHRVGEVCANGAGGVGKPVGELRGLGVQEETRGFAGACRENDCASVYAFLSASCLIYVRDTFGFAIFAKKDFTRHRAGDHRELAGLHRGRDHHLAGAEVRRGDAATAALAAVVAAQSATYVIFLDGHAGAHTTNAAFVGALLCD